MPNLSLRYVWFVALLAPVFWLLVSGGNYVYLVTQCNSAAPTSSSYIAYCPEREYGSFEHQAFFYGLERTRKGLSEANVLFLGNSKSQFAFSRANVEPFFAERKARFFLMGFGYNEGVRFAEMVLRRHVSKPNIVIINVDQFFQDYLSEPATFLERHPYAGFVDALFKSSIQSIRAHICEQVELQLVRKVLCQGQATIIRSHTTGQWSSALMTIETIAPFPIRATEPIKHETNDETLSAWVSRTAAAATSFFKVLDARCIVLTSVPSEHNDSSSVSGRLLAERLKVRFISPEISGLSSNDRHRLNTSSAIKWSDAFLRELDSLGPECGAWSRLSVTPNKMQPP